MNASKDPWGTLRAKGPELNAVDDDTLNAHRLADVTVDALQVEESRFICRGLEAAGFAVPRDREGLLSVLEDAKRSGYRWEIRESLGGRRFGQLVGPAGPVPGSPRVQYPNWWKFSSARVTRSA